MKKVMLAIAIISVISSCKKGLQEELIPLELNVNNIETITVIDAKIEKDSTAWVQISYSEDINALFTEKPNYETNANIEISDGSSTDFLTYIGNGVYRGNSMLGQVGKTYTIFIDIDGTKYNASSTMYKPATLRDITLTPYQVTAKDGSSSYTAYDENWVVNDPSETRNRYLFEWWTNGVHNAQTDWAIDDNRVVNANEGLSLFNPQRDVYKGEVTTFRVSEIDKITYDYFNMYEKIVRGIASAGDQTPYNPVSSFGPGTIGNFRAVAFSSYTVSTVDTAGNNGWKNVTATSGVGEITITWDNYDGAYEYIIFWKNEPGIIGDKNSNENIITGDKSSPLISPYLHTGLDKNLTYYYRVMAVSKVGNSLSEEVSAMPD
jgi:hypothetical protein